MTIEANAKVEEQFRTEERIVGVYGDAPSPNPKFPSSLRSVTYSFKRVFFNENNKPFGYGDTDIRHVGWFSYSFEQTVNTDPKDVVNLIREKLLREKKDIEQALAVLDKTNPIFIDSEKEFHTEFPESWKDKRKKSA